MNPGNLSPTIVPCKGREDDVSAPFRWRRDDVNVSLVRRIDRHLLALKNPLRIAQKPFARSRAGFFVFESSFRVDGIPAMGTFTGFPTKPA